MLVWSDRPREQGTRSPIELFWTAKKERKGRSVKKERGTTDKKPDKNTGMAKD